MASAIYIGIKVKWSKRELYSWLGRWCWWVMCKRKVSKRPISCVASFVLSVQLCRPKETSKKVFHGPRESAERFFSLIFTRLWGCERKRVSRASGRKRYMYGCKRLSCLLSLGALTLQHTNRVLMALSDHLISEGKVRWGNLSQR